MNETDALLTEIETYLAASRVAQSTFGRLSVNDGKLVSRLRAGGSVTLAVAEKIRAYIAQHPPTKETALPPFPVAEVAE